MSCKHRVAGKNGTFKCNITQSQCYIEKDTNEVNQENCEIRQAFKDL